ncbi:hypothetical protein [Streptomyces albireticuli]
MNVAGAGSQVVTARPGRRWPVRTPSSGDTGRIAVGVTGRTAAKATAL